MRQPTKIALTAILLIWLTIVIAAYYWGHQYVLIPLVAGVVRLLGQLAVLFLIGLVAFGLGKLPSRLLRLTYRSRAEEVIFSIGLGLAFMSLIVLVLGLAEVISRPLLWILTIVILGLTAVMLFRVRGGNAYLVTRQQEPLQRIDYLFLAFIAIVFILGLLLALAPPIAWDGLSTHLVLVRDILQDGGFQPSPYAERPIVGHLLFVWGMAVGGDTLPQLLSYSQAVLMVAAVAMFARQHFGRRTAILAVAIMCSVEVFVITATWPYADLPTGMFSLLSILALANWQLGQDDGRPWLIASVIFAVFAAHAKLNGLFVYAAVLTGIVLGLWWRRRALRQRITDVVIALVVGLIIASTWTMVENSLKADDTNAVAQIANAAAGVAADGDSFGLSALLRQIANYAVVTWEMTIIGQQGGLRYDGTISPFFLILTPLLLILPKKPRVVWALLIAALVMFGSWLLAPKPYYQNRHLIGAYPLFSILAAYFVSRLPELDLPKFSISGFFRILILLVFGIQLLFFFTWYQSLDPSSYLLGFQSRDQYLSIHLNGGTSPGYYAMMQAIDEQLPEDSYIGVAWPEPRVYYCPRECIRYVFGRTSSTERMVEIARESGISHILVSKKGLQYWLDLNENEDTGNYEGILAYGDALDSFVEQYGLLELKQSDSFYLYRLALNGE